MHDGRIQSMLSAGTVDTKKKYKIYIRFIVKAREYSVCTLCNDNVHWVQCVTIKACRRR